MKTLFKILILLNFFLLIQSCSKSKVDTGIVGNWQWVITYPDNLNTPQTPTNSGHNIYVSFLPDGIWQRVSDNIIDSGTYKVGKGQYKPYTGGYTFSYDSVSFYKNNQIVGWDSYEIFNDTLSFNPYLSGRFASYMVPANGSMWFVRK